MSVADDTFAVFVDEDTVPAAVGRAISRAAPAPFLARRDQIALVVSELVTNIQKHAERGELHAQGDAHGLRILALDRGPGIRDVTRALRDGHSDRGSLGVGLGAVRRLADHVAIDSDRAGTTVGAWFGAQPAEHGAGLRRGQVVAPGTPNRVCGDGFAIQALNGSARSAVRVALFDGLGHGPAAWQATRDALEFVARSSSDQNLTAMMEGIHTTLRGTRGAVGVVATITSDEVRAVSVGNVRGHLIAPERRARLLTDHGVLGAPRTPRIRERVYTTDEPSWFVLHSDGVASAWDISLPPRLPPAFAASRVFKHAARERDDAAVLVAKVSPR